MGMADHIAFTLGGAGYRAYKMVPYGPVEETMAYLLRRAQENADVLGGCAKEVRSLLAAAVDPMHCALHAVCSGLMSALCCLISLPARTGWCRLFTSFAATHAHAFCAMTPFSELLLHQLSCSLLLLCHGRFGH